MTKALPAKVGGALFILETSPHQPKPYLVIPCAGLFGVLVVSAGGVRLGVPAAAPDDPAVVVAVGTGQTE